MMVEWRTKALRETTFSQYAIRFIFGGTCTVLAGLIAKRWGAGVGGLFLAFPAIFPAGASLIENHEKHNKARIGRDGTNRGRMAAGSDALGAALGALGLCAFAILSWRILVPHTAALVIAAATAMWLFVSVGLWELRKRRFFRRGTCK
jgi:hypothetical protein